jgi:hypothetical protein
MANLLFVPEAADKLGVSIHELLQLVETSRLEPVRGDGRLQFDEKALEAYLASR